MTFDLSKEENRVRQVQTMLRYLSFALDEPIYTVNVTGKYDKQTENAVRHFQAKNKLPVTGIVDLDTWNALSAQYVRENERRAPVLLYPIGTSADYVTPQGEVSDVVLILQAILNSLRTWYDYEHIPPSGIYERKTADAVRLFQSANSLPMTGSADRETWQRLAREYNSAYGE